MTEENVPPVEDVEEADASGEDGENLPVDAADEIDAIETEDDGEDDG